MEQEIKAVSKSEMFSWKQRRVWSGHQQNGGEALPQWSSQQGDGSAPGDAEEEHERKQKHRKHRASRAMLFDLGKPKRNTLI